MNTRFVNLGLRTLRANKPGFNIKWKSVYNTMRCITINKFLVNDPFVAVHQMAALAKFEAIKSPWQPKRIDLRVTEGPQGQFYLDGKVNFLEVFYRAYKI